MTLSVTSATTALAALQALQTSETTATAAGAAANADASQTGGSSAVSTRISTPQGLYAAVDGIGQAASAADAAGAAGQTVLGLLQQMQGLAGQAADPTANDRQGLDQQFQSGAAAIGPTIASASVNGTNLIDGSLSGALKVSLGDGTTVSLTPQNLSLGGPILGFGHDVSVATATAASSAFATLGDAIGAAGAALSTLQSQSDQISAHGGALQALGQALGSSQDASGDDARLMALQISQQLASSGGAIASGSPASVLALFRS